MSARGTDKETEARLLLDEGGRRYSTLAAADGVVRIHRPRGDTETLFFMIPASLLGFTVLAGVAAVFALMSWTAVTEFSPLAMLLAVVFGTGLAIVLWVFLQIQGLVFPFRVTLGNGRYFLANGLRRMVRPCRLEEAEASVSPVYMRGDWGIIASIRPTNRSWRWPLLPARMVGSKHEALQEALKLKEWLRVNTSIGKVELQKWGDPNLIRSGVEYIK